MMYAAVAVVSAIIGIGAIYVMVGAGDNGGSEKTATDVRAAEAKTEAPRTGTRLNTGAMATFVFRDTPTALPDLAFNGPDGKPRSLADWKGKVVLLNVWATWCAPCRKEMPYLDNLKRELGGDDFDVLAISIDRGSADKPLAFLNEIKVNALELYHDPSAQLGFTLKIIGMPATLLIDREGKEIGRLVGPAVWDSAEAKRLIKAHFGG
jgi:thiol-disulfide isomerase/thioredoxin